jgi:hypothetical protein
MRARLDLIGQQRGADMVDVPDDASGMLCRHIKGTDTGRIGLCWNGMRIDARATVGRYPTLLVRAWASTLISVGLTLAR